MLTFGLQKKLNIGFRCTCLVYFTWHLDGLHFAQWPLLAQYSGLDSLALP